MLLLLELELEKRESRIHNTNERLKIYLEKIKENPPIGNFSPDYGEVQEYLRELKEGLRIISEWKEKYLNK